MRTFRPSKALLANEIVIILIFIGCSLLGACLNINVIGIVLAGLVLLTLLGNWRSITGLARAYRTEIWVSGDSVEVRSSGLSVCIPFSSVRKAEHARFFRLLFYERDGMVLEFETMEGLLITFSFPFGMLEHCEKQAFLAMLRRGMEKPEANKGAAPG